MTVTVGYANVTVDPPRMLAFPLSSWDRKPQRTIERLWPVFEDEDRSRVWVKLDCYHSKGRGNVAKVANVREQDHGVWSEMFGADSHFTVLSEPQPRYSKPRLVAFADVALVMFRELAAAGDLEVFLLGERAPYR